MDLREDDAGKCKRTFRNIPGFLGRSDLTLLNVLTIAVLEVIAMMHSPNG